MSGEPRIEKAFWYTCTELIFGTLYTVPTPNQNPMETVEVELITDTDYKKIKLPSNWRHHAPIWVSNDGLTEFCAFYFEIEHGLDFKHPRGGRMPDQILWFLSGTMQTGEDWNYRNYQNYCRLEGLKFLPLLITHDHFRFFVFRPTSKRVEEAIEVFKKVLSILGIMGNLPKGAFEILRAVNLDEVFTDPQLWSREIGLILLSERYPLSFVYQDLKGSQDAVRFTP